jgi:hypothetical protein
MLVRYVDVDGSVMIQRKAKHDYIEAECYPLQQALY